MVTATVAFERLLNCLLLVMVLVGGEMHTPHQNAKPWSVEHGLQGKCLLLDQMSWQGVSAAKVADSNSEPLVGTRELLDSIARQITHGIVSGNDAAGSVIHNHHSSVDLTVFIANDVDNQWMSKDEYWQYYIHCDQWGVVLSEPLSVDFQGIPADETFSDESLIEMGAGVLSMATQWIGEQFQQYEFVCIEQMAELRNGPNGVVADVDVEVTLDCESTLSSETSISMLGILQRELAGRWAPVTKLFECLAKQNPMIPVDHLLDDWLFDPFLEQPYDVVSVESELEELH